MKIQDEDITHILDQLAASKASQFKKHTEVFQFDPKESTRVHVFII